MGKRVSVIIPVYNQEGNIEKSVRCLVGELSAGVVELILINDGSKDRSGEICQRLAEQYENIIYIDQENRGVSAARNAGLRRASGKYIFFLDADDALEKNTIKNVAEFFDSVYDQVDLVTYPIETIYRGKKLKPHFRYKFLKESGVYDLRTEPYIGQTTMNIVVKNQFAENILFDEGQSFSEDQRYCCDVLHRTLKMGFCRDGKYIYYRDDSSSSGKLSGACFIFEQCMRFFEELFGRYDVVPLAFQGLYVNDLYWKMTSNILFPYHYQDKQYQQAWERMKVLLERCETGVILYHPNMDFFEKYFFLRWKGNSGISCFYGRERFGLRRGQEEILVQRTFEIVMTKFHIDKGKLIFQGFIKSVFLDFFGEEVFLCAVENEGEITRKIETFSSAHNYYLSHEKTHNFRAFCYEADIEKIKKIKFEVGVCGNWYHVSYYFMPTVPFSHRLKRYIYRKDSVKIVINRQNELCICRETNTKSCGKGKRIWLYYDCSGVPCDNGLLQFEHDLLHNDGVERYYVITDHRQRMLAGYEKHYVPFGSRKHQNLFLRAEKLVTAFIEEINLIPFPAKDYDKYAGKFRFTTIYLQHGVLHIEMPWKYSPEKIMADRVIVSTEQEAALFMRNGFAEKDLWKCGMPRFEILQNEKTPNRKSEKRKILFAPSWRSYLVGKNVDHQWERKEDLFRRSNYYQKIVRFLSSQKLYDLLKQYQIQLEVKLHPIFEIYRDCFPKAVGNVSFIEKVKNESDYDLFITDISSYIYDFIFLKIPVLTFLPDWEEFMSGMNGYRRLDFPESYMSKVCREPDEIISCIQTFLESGNYPSVDVDFFDGKNSMDEIYRKMMDK